MNLLSETFEDFNRSFTDRKSLMLISRNQFNEKVMVVFPEEDKLTVDILENILKKVYSENENQKGVSVINKIILVLKSEKMQTTIKQVKNLVIICIIHYSNISLLSFSYIFFLLNKKKSCLRISVKLIAKLILKDSKIMIF